MKTLLARMLFLVLILTVSAFAQGSGVCQDDNGNFGNWEWVTVCIPGHGSISFWVCATSGSCPGSGWCPGNNGCGSYAEGEAISSVQKQGIDILVARRFVKRPVLLAENELVKPVTAFTGFKKVAFTAHGATPLPPTDGTGSDDESEGSPPSCSSCVWYDVVCLIICK